VAEERARILVVLTHDPLTVMVEITSSKGRGNNF
jgi:hypothetical protein